MDIPYTVKPRPDTGVYNAKLGIWLFLASEVMLFGGLFAAYIFLRIGAPEGTWPNGMLSVFPGLINTAVLILSSVTVVLAWASVKLNDFRGFRIYMGITLFCSVIFMGIKAYEYNDKFNHYGVFMTDTSQPSGYGLQITGHIKEDTESYYILKADKNQPVEWISSTYPKKKRKEAIPQGDDRFVHPGVTVEGHDEKSGLTLLRIEKDQIFRSSYFVPAYNSYFAIYFTMTGLHALHVIGGAIVFLYFWLPCGNKMFFSDRTHFANRIEVSGLFWHFVDLVWIFLFPIMYLL